MALKRGVRNKSCYFIFCLKLFSGTFGCRQSCCLSSMKPVRALIFVQAKSLLKLNRFITYKSFYFQVIFLPSLQGWSLILNSACLQIFLNISLLIALLFLTFLAYLYAASCIIHLGHGRVCKGCLTFLNTPKAYGIFK